jgi:hypothetical protein
MYAIGPGLEPWREDESVDAPYTMARQERTDLLGSAEHDAAFINQTSGLARARFRCYPRFRPVGNGVCLGGNGGFVQPCLRWGWRFGLVRSHFVADQD